jgi:hypothetical protein
MLTAQISADYVEQKIIMSRFSLPPREMFLGEPGRFAEILVMSKPRYMQQ